MGVLLVEILLRFMGVSFHDVILICRLFRAASSFSDQLHSGAAKLIDRKGDFIDCRAE